MSIHREGGELSRRDYEPMIIAHKDQREELMNRISHNRRLHVTIINRDDDARHDDRHNKK
jgi:hypothetical protein